MLLALLAELAPSFAWMVAWMQLHDADEMVLHDSNGGDCDHDDWVGEEEHERHVRRRRQRSRGEDEDEG